MRMQRILMTGGKALPDADERLPRAVQLGGFLRLIRAETSTERNDDSSPSWALAPMSRLPRSRTRTKSAPEASSGRPPGSARPAASPSLRTCAEPPSNSPSS